MRRNVLFYPMVFCLAALSIFPILCFINKAVNSVNCLLI
uniref:Uncharacterized protein n=1 Tax=Anguilla anguilla TaxID=7936 RepID=A0A0E9RKR1_ANGAN